MNIEPQMAKGMAERERLRPQRVLNYAAKRKAGFTCTKDGCSKGNALLAVEIDGELTCRCEPHLDGGTVAAGQWNSR